MGRASKDKRDMYYRLAKEEGYRARSAYKLLQLHEELGVLNREGIRTGVVDLCAAPGSWSQVLARHLRGDGGDVTTEAKSEDVRIVAVDLQEMMPIEGVQLLQGDITSESTAREIIRLLNSNDVINNNNNNNNVTMTSNSEKKADLVVCDGAPDVTGMHELDEYLQHHLLLAALNITTFVLRRGGTFVTKMFRGPNTPFLVAKSEVFFRHVMIAKPKSSRNASMEAFMVCQDYQPPRDYTPSFDRPLATTMRNFTPAAPLPPALMHSNNNKPEGEEIDEEGQREAGGRVIVPFLACGDLSGYDADMCYDRDVGAPVLPPVHPPRQAPYLAACNSAQGFSATGNGAEDVKRRRVE